MKQGKPSYIVNNMRTMQTGEEEGLHRLRIYKSAQSIKATVRLDSGR